jgi:hypothetical protein
MPRFRLSLSPQTARAVDLPNLFPANAATIGVSAVMKSRCVDVPEAARLRAHRPRERLRAR